MNRLLATFACLISLSGCAVTIPIGGGHHIPVSASESVYQTLNALDFAQTGYMEQLPARCFQERDPVTSAFTGPYPSTGRLAAFWALQSVAHLAITGWLDREIEATDSDKWRGVKFVWQLASIGSTAYAIVDSRRNYQHAPAACKVH